MLEDIKYMVEWSKEHNHNPVDSLSKEELLWLIEQAEKVEVLENKLENAIFTDTIEEPKPKRVFPLQTFEAKVTYGGRLPVGRERE